VNNPAANRSPELDEVRRLLFPGLSPEDGWARIDLAFSRAADPEQWRKIEALAAREGLSADLAAVLLARLKELNVQSGAAMDNVIADYFAAWNERDPDQRRRRLERCLTDDAVLVDPTGRWQGVAGLAERIGRYQSAAPETEVVIASGVDAHNDLVRYAWKIVDQHGDDVIEGIDVAEHVDDGRLRRILMFHGPLPPAN
jgi:predicted TIM-barrel enzyme